MHKGELIYVRLPPELVVDLDDLAEENGVSRTAMVTVLLSMAIGHIRKEWTENLST